MALNVGGTCVRDRPGYTSIALNASTSAAAQPPYVDLMISAASTSL